MVTVTLATSQDQPLLEPFFAHYGAQAAARLDCFLTHNHTIVARHQGQIVGILQWQVKEDPSLGVAEFEEVYVLPAFQRQGIGSQLVDFALTDVSAYFKNLNFPLRRLYLFVSENNLPACHLYEKFNFKLVANLGHLFSDSENELMYSLSANL